MREAEGPTAGGQTSLLRWSQTTWAPGAADPEVKAGSAIYLFTLFCTLKTRVIGLDARLAKESRLITRTAAAAELRLFIFLCICANLLNKVSHYYKGGFEYTEQILSQSGNFRGV